MANRFFRKYVHSWLTTGGPNLATAVLKVLLVDTADDTPNTAIAGDEFLSDILAAAREATTLQLANVTVVDGVLDADDPALPDDGGDTAENLILFADTGVETTSKLLILIDTATGLPITPDSVADSIQWDPTGILAVTG